MRQLTLDSTHRVLAVLCDGQLHDHRDIAAQADLSLDLLNTVILQLAEGGVSLRTSKHGVVLDNAAQMSLLKSDSLLAVLAPSVAQRIDMMKISAVCGSTNDLLDTSSECRKGRFHVALSDAQTAGRGRQGNAWASPFGGGIYMSLTTHWAPLPDNTKTLPSNLPLAIGVAVAEQLQALVCESIQLKWPNDLIARHHKLGGLMLESRVHPAGGYQLLIGLGINLQTPDLMQPEFANPTQRAMAALPPIGLSSLERNGSLPNRSALTAMILNTVIASIDVYRSEGFASFQSRWQQRDYLFQRQVQLHAAPGQLMDSASGGVAQGITSDGSLRVATETGEFTVRGGEISVRRS